MNQQFDLIGHYAHLKIAEERWIASGYAVPPDITRQIQSIEARANTTLGPAQLRAAMEHVNVAKARILQAENINAHTAQRASREKLKDEAIHTLTRGMAGQGKGLNEAQFVAVRDGKPIPVRKRTTPEEMDASARRLSQDIDPTGKGWTVADLTSRFDELADASDKDFPKLATGYRAPPEELKQRAKQWKVGRLEYGLKKRLNERSPGNDEPPVVNDDTRRRAQVVDSYLQTVKSPKDVEGVVDEIPDRMMEDPGRMGDIARAWDATEASAPASSEPSGAAA